ncbi:MAG TPA: hypothetical protein VD927_19875 [Chryseosolibacter sp.]|nr:hypothetical protein [Chryseosolibacter sp.]
MENINLRLQKRIQASLYAILFMSGLLGLSVVLEGCTDSCEATSEYVYYEPVYTTLDEIRNAVAVEEPRSITSAGRIYIKGKWLFVNEPGAGVHVINNETPSAPIHKSFINVPGSYDLVVKGNILYADSYVDLVALDISDVNQIREVKRLQNVFSNYNTLGFYLDASRGLITDWVEKKEVKVYESDCDANIQPWGGIYYQEGIAVSAADSFNKSAAFAPGNGSGPGVGGSMARFTINADYIYALDGADIQAVNITTLADPVVSTRTTIAWDIETIFPYKQNLFIGSRSGMHIVDVSVPSSPSLISTYEHMRVCDPVVVQDTLAYVTLRSGTECEGFANQLEVINIADLMNPQLVSLYPMTNPHGLGIDESTLFVCDGQAGLRVFDASDIYHIADNTIAHYQDINAYDVIPFNNILIMLAADGIYQYDYTDPDNIYLLSKIAVGNAGS